jgi:hypothetical protein
MDFLLGLLTAVVFFIALLYCYYHGYKQGSKKSSVPANEEEIRKARTHAEDLVKLMTYDVEKAQQRKKVT